MDENYDILTILLLESPECLSATKCKRCGKTFQPVLIFLVAKTAFIAEIVFVANCCKHKV